MSLHPSLRSSKSKRHKSVLTRLEKILRLQKEERWREEDSVLGLPKVKVTRIKIKKEKVAKAPEAAEGAAAATPEAAAQEAKTAPIPQAKQEAAKRPAEKEKK